MNTFSITLSALFVIINMLPSASPDDSLQSLDASSATFKNAKSLNVLSSLRQQIQEKETELEKAEKINRNFERMIQLVNIMGQVDTFLTDRTKVMLKKLALLADDMDDYADDRKRNDIRF